MLPERTIHGISILNRSAINEVRTRKILARSHGIQVFSLYKKHVIIILLLLVNHDDFIG